MTAVAAASQTTAPAAASASVGRPSALAYGQIALGVLLVTSAEIMLKVGATSSPESGDGGTQTVFGFSALASLWTWGGILCYVLSLVNWLAVLRRVPLIIAFNLLNAVHVAIPLAAWWLLKEAIPLPRIVGIGLVVCGLVLLAGNVAKAEEKL